jgi:hypothetical protein
MRDKLNRIEELARERSSDIDELEALNSLKPQVQSVPRTPHRTRGLEFMEEGIATPRTAGEEVEVSFSLPAPSISFNLRPGRYEVRLCLGGSGSVDVYDISSEKQLVKSRRTTEKVVLDLEGSAFRIEGTPRIRQVEIRQYKRRQTGVLEVGPFRAQGIVSASVVGEGDWTATVASAPAFEGSIDFSQNPPAYNGDGTLWRGTPPSDSQPDPPESYVSGPIAHRFSGAPALDLEYARQMRAGTVLSSYETRKLEEPADTGPGMWWDGLGEWMVLGGSDAPAFDPRPGFWTHVWGSASGADKAYSLRTGRPATPTNGAYLIRTEDPESVDIDGIHGHRGRPFTEEEKPRLTPGTYAHAEVEQAPERVFVKLRGSGIARKIQIEERQRLGPEGMEVTSTRRVDLADFFRPGTRGTHSPVAEGQGQFLPG